MEYVAGFVAVLNAANYISVEIALPRVVRRRIVEAQASAVRTGIETVPGLLIDGVDVGKNR